MSVINNKRQDAYQLTRSVNTDDSS